MSLRFTSPAFILKKKIIQEAKLDKITGKYVSVYALLSSTGVYKRLGRTINLNWSLLFWCNTRLYRGFKFWVFDYEDEAFQKQCRLYHTNINSLDNKIHPMTPDFSIVKCPVKKCWSNN